MRSTLRALAAYSKPDPDPVPEPQSGPSERMREILQQPVGVVFEKIHIVDLFEVLQDNYEVNIAIDWSVVAPKDSDSPDDYVTDGLVEYVNLTNVTLKQALMAVLRPLGLVPIIEGDIITSTTPEKITENNVAHLNAGPESLPRNPKMEALLANVVTLHPGKSPHLSRVLDFLADQSDINIMLDNRVVAPATGVKRKTPDTVITDGILEGTWDFDNAPARVVLEDVLSELGLTYTTQNGFIWITSPEYAKHESFENLVTQYYRIPASLKSRMGFVGEFASAEQWRYTLDKVAPKILEPVSGKALSFKYYNLANSQLIVHSTPSLHGNLKDFFDNPDFNLIERLPELSTFVYHLDSKAVKHFGTVKNWTILTASLRPVLDSQDRDITILHYHAKKHQLIAHQTDENHQRVAWYLGNIEVNTE